MTGPGGSALSEAALQAALRDIRLPPVAPGGLAAELAASVALACLVALGVAGLLRALAVRRPARTEPDAPRARLAAALALPEPERRLALLRLLKTVAPDRFVALRAGLYRPDGGPDSAALRAEIDRHV
ncbi:hypothetical protein DKT77_04675 [Meridianimarinicoccus roseus]|uniref:Uncharacterized protein n=1 Tax=Meridianimarinicoccus roseus TaxID=2072018 RepID=A0A2V2LKU1_9RHOB|nr:hypothetical protein [Meridianimarinicoccus roseus]PWR03806.1 hypothetical protein DKT77_04675 [Meridianimarinicoccus roseus]